MDEKNDQLRELVKELDDPKNFVPSSSQQAPDDLSPQCEVCGRQDETVRIVIYPFVLSLVVLTFRRVFSGVWCRRHQLPRLLAAGTITSILGWLGIPYGFIYTPVALVQLARGGIRPRDSNASLLKQIAIANLQAGRPEIALKALLNALEFSDTEEIRNLIKEVAPRQVGTLIPPEPTFSSFLRIWLILGGMIVTGLLIGLINMGLGFAFGSTLPEKVNLFVAILTWAPFLALGFIGGLLIQAGVLAFQNISRNGHWFQCLIVGLISPILAWYSILLGEGLGVYLRDLISGEVFKTIQEGLGYLGSVLTVGGYEQLTFYFSNEQYIWIVIWTVIGIYFLWSGLFAARKSMNQIRLGNSALPGATPPMGMSLQPLLALGIFLVGVAGAFILFQEPIGEAAVTEEAVEYVTEGWALIQQNEFLAAREAFDQALEINPDMAEAHFGVGISYIVYGLYEPALASFENALELDPSIPDYMAFTGTTLVYLDRTDEAYELLDQVLDLDPQRTVEAEARYGLGMIAFYEEDFEEATFQFKRVVILDPDYLNAHVFLMLLYWVDYQYEEVIESAETLIGFDPTWSAPYAYLANAHFQLDQRTQAEMDLANALQQQHQDYISTLALMDILVNFHRIDEAVELGEEALENDDTNTGMLVALVRIYGIAQRTEEALSIADEWTERYPDDFLVYLARNSALAYTGQFEEANDSLQMALDLGADLSDVYGSMSYNYYYLGDYEEAYRIAQLAIEDDSNDHYATIRFALAALALGKVDEGCQSAETAAEMRPMVDLVQLALGICAYEGGDTQAAETHLELFLELFLDRPNMEVHLAQAHSILAEIE